MARAEQQFVAISDADVQVLRQAEDWLQTYTINLRETYRRTRNGDRKLALVVLIRALEQATQNLAVGGKQALQYARSVCQAP